MKKNIILFSVIFLVVFYSTCSAKPVLNGSSFLLMEAETGQVLLEQNPDAPMNPASTTKIMTAILALEKLPLPEKVTASNNVLKIIGTRLYINPGDVLTVEQLLYALLLHSANDAALVLAEHIAGSVDEFAEMMTRRARELGAFNTTFKNPHGLTEEGHITTARDLAIISRYAMSIPQFREIVSTPDYLIQGEHHDKDDIRIVNTNRLLNTFEGATGIKTGYTIAAGHTIVASAKRDDMELIAVVLNSPSRATLWNDAAKLLDYGFNEFEKIHLVSANEIIDEVKVKYGRSVSLYAERDFSYILPKGTSDVLTSQIVLSDFAAPIAKDSHMGDIHYYYNGQKIAEVSLRALNSVPKRFYAHRGFQRVLILAVLYIFYSRIRKLRAKRKGQRYVNRYVSLQRYR